jgi:micrococcal nuclease
VFSAAIALTDCLAGNAREASVAPHRGPPPTPAAMAMRATVAHVVDGDTIIVMARARRTRVRLLGLDAPEAGRRPDCFGARATAGLRRLLPAGTAILVAVDRRRADPYGRALGHVWRADGVFVNRDLIRRGYATTLFLPPAGPYRDELAAAEAVARAARAGLWRVCRNTP